MMNLVSWRAVQRMMNVRLGKPTQNRRPPNILHSNVLEGGGKKGRGVTDWLTMPISANEEFQYGNE